MLQKNYDLLPSCIVPAGRKVKARRGSRAGDEDGRPDDVFLALWALFFRHAGVWNTSPPTSVIRQARNGCRLPPRRTIAVDDWSSAQVFAFFRKWTSGSYGAQPARGQAPSPAAPMRYCLRGGGPGGMQRGLRRGRSPLTGPLCRPPRRRPKRQDAANLCARRAKHYPTRRTSRAVPPAHPPGSPARDRARPGRAAGSPAAGACARPRPGPPVRRARDRSAGGA